MQTSTWAENYVLVEFLEVDQISPLRAEQAVDRRPGHEFKAETTTRAENHVLVEFL